jgi:hypothetical protein
MALMTDVQSVAANTTTTNILAGKLEEFLKFPSHLQFAIVAAAVGLHATIIVGNDVVVDDQEVSDANRTPVIPDDVLVEGVGGAADRLVIKLRNSTGAAIIAKTRVNVTPI